MQDMIAKGASWFDQQRKKHLAVTVEYQAAGTMFAKSFPATIGMSRWDSIDASGQMIRFETRDYFVGVDEMRDNPRRGDRIHETDASGIRRTYEVMVPGGANNPWSWADRGQRIRRIHTQLVESD
jgi:hypothetical protein